MPKSELGSVWDQASRFIDMAWAKAPGYFTSIDIFDRILRDVEVLWAVFDDDLEMVGCFTTVVEEYPQSRVLLIACLAGRKPEVWLPEAAKILKRFAKDNGCTKMEAKGRKGWAPFGTKNGWQSDWKEIGTVYQYDLED